MKQSSSYERQLMTTASLHNQVAVVTGASQGIGRGLAVALAREGCRLALCARSLDKLQSLAAELRNSGAKVLIERVDVSKEADVDRFFSLIQREYDRVDILVNNAGAF